jgi:hypothetical protein
VLASRLTFVCMYQVAETALRPQEKLVMTDAKLSSSRMPRKCVMDWIS